MSNLVLPMELPGGLATIDPRHLAQCQSTLQFGFKCRHPLFNLTFYAPSNSNRFIY
jgi:hypothetical protein